MKKFILVLLSVITIDSYCSVYYVSTYGKDADPGTISLPWLTWQKAFSTAESGDTVFIRGGTYYINEFERSGVSFGVLVSDKHGSVARMITIQNYPGEIPVLDGSKMAMKANRRGVSLSNCSYFLLKGLTIRNVREYGQYPGCPLASGFTLSNCSNIRVERCTVQGCGDGFNTIGFCNYIDFLNCDAFDNVDFTDKGGYANGFTLTMYKDVKQYAAGTHVSLTGCRSWGNSDDGYDTYGANGYFIYSDCWAFDNGRYEGNGDGFKSHPFGKEEPGIQRTYIRCHSFNNKGSGFTTYVVGIEDLNDCISYQNGENGFGYNNGNDVVCTFRNNISFRNGMAQYAGKPGFININNSWNNGVSIKEADFVSLDTTGVRRARKSDGSLPGLDFLKLVPGARLIDRGEFQGFPYRAKPPVAGLYSTILYSTPGQKECKIPFLKLFLTGLSK